MWPIAKTFGKNYIFAQIKANQKKEYDRSDEKTDTAFVEF